MVPPHSYDIAYHECGHAFVSNFLGVDVFKIQVISNQNSRLHHWLVDKKGKALKDVSGVCEPVEDFLVRVQRAKYNMRNRDDVCLRQAAISIAGPLSSNIILNNSLAACFALYNDDVENCKRCLSYTNVKRARFNSLCFVILQLLLSSTVKKIMEEAAAKLAWSGTMRGKDFDRICRGYLGTPSARFKISN